MGHPFGAGNHADRVLINIQSDIGGFGRRPPERTNLARETSATRGKGSSGFRWTRFFFSALPLKIVFIVPDKRFHFGARGRLGNAFVIFPAAQAARGAAALWCG